MDGPGLDEFPGGTIEAGDTPAEAAIRECMEEAGVAVVIGDVLDQAAGTCRAGPIEVWFLAATPQQETQPLSPFTWVGLAELASRNFPATNRRVLAELQQRYGGS